MNKNIRKGLIGSTVILSMLICVALFSITLISTNIDDDAISEVNFIKRAELRNCADNLLVRLNKASSSMGNSLLHIEGIHILGIKKIRPKVSAIYVSLDGFSIGKTDLVSVVMDQPYPCETKT